MHLLISAEICIMCVSVDLLQLDLQEELVNCPNKSLRFHHDRVPLCLPLIHRDNVDDILRLILNGDIRAKLYTINYERY